MDIERELKRSKDQWEYKVYLLINDEEIPPGYVITYGGLAARANRKYGLNVCPLNVGNLRRKLYHMLSHDTKVPLHRIGTKGDDKSLEDSNETQVYNQRLRSAEGSWPKPTWLYK